MGRCGSAWLQAAATPDTSRKVNGARDGSDGTHPPELGTDLVTAFGLLGCEQFLASVQGKREENDTEATFTPNTFFFPLSWLRSQAKLLLFLIL